VARESTWDKIRQLAKHKVLGAMPSTLHKSRKTQTDPNRELDEQLAYRRSQTSFRPQLAQVTTHCCQQHPL